VGKKASQENVREGDNLEELSLEGGIILKSILKK